MKHATSTEKNGKSQLRQKKFAKIRNTAFKTGLHLHQAKSNQSPITGKKKMKHEQVSPC